MSVWLDPEHVGRRREPLSTLRRAVPDGGTTCLDLDGAWRFQLLATPTAAPGPRWRTAQVPGCWTTEPDLWGEVPDPPWYTNDQMPWPDLPPTPPTGHNPTGVYERDVEVPAHWAGQRVLLHVGAAESVLLAHIDGHEVGSSTDSHLAAEFDVTAWAAPGSTVRVRLTVVKWSSATFLEDQDQWWHGGITRSVRLFTRPQLHLSDLRTVAAADGQVTVDVRVGSDAGRLPSGWRVRVELNRIELAFDADAHARDLADERISLYRGRARFDGSFPGLARWSAETPALHRLRVELRDADGNLTDAVEQRVGLRTVEVSGPDLLLNGRRIMVRGMNRHDRDPLTGRVVTVEQMRAELLTLKRFGFNAVRSAHYPNDPAFLDLTDELGLYVVDEANIETHAWAHELCDDPAYLPAFTTRVARMIRRDRNHPSVIIWSLGNESDYGANHDAAAAWIRADDPTRPVQYEGAVKDDWGAGSAGSDIVCPMYASIEQLVGYATGAAPTRPLIQCEYSHAMGNSNGSLADYWAAYESLPGLQGGFVWEFADHAILQRTADRRPAGRAGAGHVHAGVPDQGYRWAHGGDFGDNPNDGAFCLDGMTLPDRTVKPAMFEHREIASPVRIFVQDGRVGLRNALDFRDLGHLRGCWRLEATDGTSVDVPADLPSLGPGESTLVDLPAHLAEVGTGQRTLQLILTQADATAWAPAGAPVGRPWVSLPARPGPVAQERLPVLESLPGPGELSVLEGRPELTLWREPTDNDEIGADAARWRRAGLDTACPAVVSVTTDTAASPPATVEVSRLTSSAGDVLHTRRLFLRADPARPGEGGPVLNVEESVQIPPGLDDLPRVGIRLRLRSRPTRVRWFGAGPWETYPDRCRAPVGWHECPAGELGVAYVRPQENGARTAVRELEVVTEADLLHFSFPRPVTFTLSGNELVLDGAHRGLGTASCGQNTLPQYRIGPGRLIWSWSLRLPGAALGRDR